MERIKTGFIKPNREIILLEYYELESWCKKEIEKYITEDRSKLNFRLEQFKQFSSDYTYFKSYLDFVIFEMKYIQINPFFMKETFGYAEENQYFLNKRCSDNRDVLGNGAFYFNKATDKNYNIQNGGIIENGMIDVNGNVIELFSEGDTDSNAWGHPGLSCMILNQYCAFNKLLCEDFQVYAMEEHPNIYTMYLMERLGFAQVTKRRSHQFIHLKPSLCTKNQVQIAYAIKEYYGHELLPCGKKSDESRKEKQLIKEIWGDVYENR